MCIAFNYLLFFINASKATKFYHHKQSPHMLSTWSKNSNRQHHTLHARHQYGHLKIGSFLKTAQLPQGIRRVL